MKKATLLIVSLFMAASVLPVAAADLKIGVVNIPRIMEEAPQADSARKALENEFKPRERDLVEGQKDVRGMEEKLQRNGAIMSESERRKLENDIRNRMRDLKRDEDIFREDLNIKRTELLEKLQRELLTVIQAFAKENKFDLLLADGVVYANDALDVTEQVLSSLKKESK